MLNIPEIESELINLERNTMTGKIEHPVNGSKDISDSFAGALASASMYTDMDELVGVGNFDSLFDVNDDITTGVSSNEKYMNEYMKQLSNDDTLIVDNENIEKDFKELFSDEVDRFVAKHNDIDQREELRKKRSEQLMKREREMMSDESFENRFFGNDDDFIIW